jgi:outer membrane receptor protein involved in Fe transport
VDHRFNDKVNIFGRYNYSPSSIDERGFTGSLNSVSPFGMKLHTATIGATWTISPRTVNDLRLNYRTALGTTVFNLDNFGGAVPLTSLPFPPPFNATNGLLRFAVDSLGGNGELVAGAADGNKQKQYNLVDDFTLQAGTHGLKFGVDYRRLSPAVLGGPADNGLWYAYLPDFPDIPSADGGIPGFSFVQVTLPVTFLFRNIGAFAQDTWKVTPRLTLTYGIRWDVDFSPATVSGPDLSAVTGFNLANLSNLALAPAGTPPYATSGRTSRHESGPPINCAQMTDGRQSSEAASAFSTICHPLRPATFTMEATIPTVRIRFRQEPFLCRSRHSRRRR